MKNKTKNILMALAVIGAVFTATEASARGRYHHHHGSKDLYRAAAIVDIVANSLTGLSILSGKAPVVVAPAPVVTPAPVYVAPSRSVYRRPAPPRRVRTTPPPRSPRPARHR